MKVIYLFVLTMLIPLTVYADWFITGPTDVCPNTEQQYNLRVGCGNCQSRKWTIRVEGGVLVKRAGAGIASHCAPDCNPCYGPFWDNYPIGTTTFEFVDQAMNDIHVIRWGTEGVPGKIIITGGASVSCCLAWGNSTTCPTSTKEYEVNVRQPVLTAPAVMCVDETKSFSLNESCNSTSYSWITPTGWSIEGGTNTLAGTSLRTVNIKAPSSATAGFYEIKAKNNLRMCLGRIF